MGAFFAPTRSLSSLFSLLLFSPSLAPPLLLLASSSLLLLFLPFLPASSSPPPSSSFFLLPLPCPVLQQYVCGGAGRGPPSRQQRAPLVVVAGSLPLSPPFSRQAPVRVTARTRRAVGAKPDRQLDLPNHLLKTAFEGRQGLASGRASQVAGCCGGESAEPGRTVRCRGRASRRPAARQEAKARLLLLLASCCSHSGSAPPASLSSLLLAPLPPPPPPRRCHTGVPASCTQRWLPFFAKIHGRTRRDPAPRSLLPHVLLALRGPEATLLCSYSWLTCLVSGAPG